MIPLTPIVSRAKSKLYKPKIVKKLALNSQLLIVEIVKNDVQVLILCLSYLITMVNKLETMFLCIYTKSNPSWFHLNFSLKTPRCTLVKTYQAYLIFQNQGCCPARLVVFGKVYPHFFMVPLIHKLILGLFWAELNESP